MSHADALNKTAGRGGSKFIFYFVKFLLPLATVGFL